MDDTSNQIKRLLEAPMDDLYLEIGAQLGGRRAFPLPPKMLIDEAMRWTRDTLSKPICGNRKLQELAKQDIPTQELILSVTGSLDLLGHILGAVPAVTVAVLIVRVGLHKFCSTAWAEGSNPPPTSHG
jgi:hypothetical protein